MISPLKMHTETALTQCDYNDAPKPCIVFTSLLGHGNRDDYTTHNPLHILNTAYVSGAPLQSLLLSTDLLFYIFLPITHK